MLLAALTASLVPTAAQAGYMSGPTKTIMLKQAFTYDGQKWLQTVYGYDNSSSTDSLSVSFAKVFKKKNSAGKLVYSLRESQSFYFSGLDDSTVTVTSGLLGAINLGNQMPGIFSGKIQLAKITGKDIVSKCNGNIKTRVVKSTGTSSMSLQTNNSVFGTVKNVPAKGIVTTDNGKCTSSGGSHCGRDSSSLSGSGSLPGNGHLYVSASLASGASMANVYASSSHPISDVSYPMYASHSASMMGKVVKSRVDIAANLSTGSFDASGLPKLSGKANANSTGRAEARPYTNCSKTKKERAIDRPAALGGTFGFTPSGESKVSLSEVDPTTSYAYLSRWDVANR